MSRNYARFYVLLNRLPTTDREELKAQLVSQFTGGRTESLREMTDKEYDALCDELQRQDANRRARELYRAELRRRRSAALHLMQKLGIDTTGHRHHGLEPGGRLLPASPPGGQGVPQADGRRTGYPNHQAAHHPAQGDGQEQ